MEEPNAFHVSSVKLLCRLCASRCRIASDKRISKKCTNYKVDIFKVYGIDISNDNSSFHPDSFCEKCYRRILNYKHHGCLSDNDVKTISEIKDLNRTWTVTTCNADCWVCMKCEIQRKGGRPQKFSRKGKKFCKKIPSDCLASSPQKCHDKDMPNICDVTTACASTMTTPPRQLQKSFKEAQTSPFVFSESAEDAPLSSCLQKPLQEPLNQFEEKLQTHLVKRKLLSSTEKDVLSCKTGGQPILLKRVKKARKSSSVAKSPLKKRRSLEMSKLQLIIAGESSSSAQYVSNLKRITCQKRELICARAGIKSRLKVSSKYGVAMRTFLGLSWQQYRKQKQFLAQVGLKFGSEKKERKEQNDFLGENIESQMIKMEVSTDDHSRMESLVPISFIKDFPKFLHDLLDKYNDAGKLTWHEGQIPEDEIWLKVGGDHGGGSFKMTFQIANLENPNSKHNTHILSIFEAKDSRRNIDSALALHKEQLKNLEDFTWCGKTLKLFVYGDYDFLTKLYGLSGAAGKHPCLWCQTSKSSMNTSPSCHLPVPERTLTNLKKDHKKFIEKGNSLLSKASLYKNVINTPLLPVPIKMVCPPYLHLLLGIVKKHHVMLEKECHELDISIGMEENVNLENVSNSFKNYAEKCCEINQLKNKEKKINSTLERINDTTPLVQLKKKEEEMKKRLFETQKSISIKIKENKLPERKGPVASQLDGILKDHKITPQAYHGRSFVGNHCRKYLQPAVYTDICRSVTSSVTRLTTNSKITTRAYYIREIYEELNKRFADVHALVAHDGPITEKDIPKIKEAIKQYMYFFRRRFPSCPITPKMHILEHHVADWIQRWGFGMGFHGEQGGEQIHATINLLKRRAWGIRSQEAKYFLIMKEHHLQVSPDVRKLVQFHRKK